MLGVAAGQRRDEPRVGVRAARGSHGSLNMRGAYIHVLGDLLGSVGTVIAAVHRAVHRVALRQTRSRRS